MKRLPLLLAALTLLQLVSGFTTRTGGDNWADATPKLGNLQQHAWWGKAGAVRMSQFQQCVLCTHMCACTLVCLYVSS